MAEPNREPFCARRPARPVGSTRASAAPQSTRAEARPGQFEASWDGPTGSVTVNRGSWTVTPMGQGRTLLVYSLEAEIAPFPNFVVRNVQLSREMEVVGAVADWLRKHDPQ